jgi:hypothetical protein
MPFPYKKNVFTSAILCIWSWGDMALECPQINTVVITTQALSIAAAGRSPAAARAVGTRSGLLSAFNLFSLICVQSPKCMHLEEFN